jgi:hypothetical protein
MSNLYFQSHSNVINLREKLHIEHRIYHPFPVGYVICKYYGMRGTNRIVTSTGNGSDSQGVSLTVCIEC